MQLPPEIFQVHTGTSEPIYRQFLEQARRLIASGQVCVGDGFPSVRDVANTLGVNPMTVSKAYGLMEMQGLLVRRRGAGMFVAELEPEASSHDKRLDLLRPGLERVANEARQLEVAPAAVIALLRTIMEGEQG